MKRLALLALTLTVSLWAADFWAKPYAEWNDKELQLMITDSPWADRMAVETGQRGAIGNADDKGGAIQGNLTAPITVVWATALPVKQAMARLTPGPAATAMLERQETSYVLRLVGFPGSVRGAALDTAKLTAETTIKVKGKPDLHPADIQIPGAAPAAAAGGTPGRGGPGGGRGGPGGATFEIFMVFPKTANFSVDDKEIEFATKVGAMSIRKKFKLKDMLYNGKLEM
ncbi:MAG: hypothetical protein ABI811_09375 [Acidobacteriota bacterium]